ncbi:ribosomal protein L7/L12 [Aeoliella mucimassa]|uniref:50S ribosomal protein L7/L12 n=1 Tax=Aeoliella mucimassa TaxID=2527972 RepID=A0A518AKE2_9BACT|nr:ribosomal protein L7/L12 [Aeoliella mucimassa]QDU55207.1 50S ribosomal protein L7/L12 [Aeoliella mucimassa]
MPLTDETRDQITECLFAGRKIEAIKLYRDATGTGLKEAKDFVDTLSASLREEYPEKMPAEGSGCGAAVLVCAGLATASLYSWLV